MALCSDFGLRAQPSLKISITTILQIIIASKLDCSEKIVGPYIDKAASKLKNIKKFIKS